MTSSSLPLEGVSVLEMAAGLAGPFCGAWMADMGASVIKVEPPVTGERTRGTLPLEDGFSPFFLACNRGKRGMTLDLKSEDGAVIARKLIARSDVMINNYRPAVLERLGLGYEDSRVDNPRLVWAQASGYGSRGPRSDRGAVDLTAQAAGGLASVTGTEESGPLLAGASIADMTLALCLLSGIVSALYAREHTGVGDRVDSSLIRGQLLLQSTELAHHSVTQDSNHQGRSGGGHRLFPPTYACYETADGYVAVAGVGAMNWEGFCDAVGMPELCRDSRFLTQDLRTTNGGELRAELERAFVTRTTAEWECIFGSLGIQTSPVADYDSLLSDEQYVANGDLDYVSSHNRSVALVGAPARFESADVRPQGLAPELGQHTEEILLELGYEWPDIVSMRDAGTI